MIRYGIVDNNDNSSLSIFEGNNLLFASQSERFSKHKNDNILSESMLKYCIDKYGLPDKINYFENPPTLRLLLKNKFVTKKTIENNLNNKFGKKIPIDYKDHHLCHASTGFYTSNFNEACIVVCDGVGQYDTVSIYKANHVHGIKKVFNIKYPHSIGLFYTAFTDYIGLKPNRDEYILMGLSAYGKPIYSNFLLNKYFYKNNLNLKENFHSRIETIKYLNNFKKEDLARSIQEVFEDYLYKLLKKAKILVNSDNLILSGGCALNSLNNGKILNYKLFSNIFIPSNPGDGGLSLGACALDVGKINYKNDYHGYEIKSKYQIDLIIKELLLGKPVGVASGKAEFGPRALGNRSILLDPRLKDGKMIMNKLKNRQSFRPFASMILEKYASDYFSISHNNHSYMQYCVNVKTKDFPSITHVDNTTRLQIITDKTSIAYEILNRYNDITGCPILLNTSLNIKDQPILNDYKDIEEFIGNNDINIYS